MSRALVFGGSGALGGAAVIELEAAGWDVVVAGRSSASALDVSRDDWPTAAASNGPFDGIVWAQGANLTGGVLETSATQMHDLFEANVVFVTDTLRELVTVGALTTPARGVVLSSVWQVTARSNKLAYVASKAALAGVVPALAVDMTSHRFAINAVLPGVIDTPMTRANLTAEQLAGVQSATIGGELATPSDVGRAVAWLLDPRAAGINGQSIVVDNGWSVTRSV